MKNPDVHIINIVNIENRFGIPKTIVLESLPGLQMLKDARN